jgi:hypothetical protein
MQTSTQSEGIPCLSAFISGAGGDVGRRGVRVICMYSVWNGEGAHSGFTYTSPDSASVVIISMIACS